MPFTSETELKPNPDVRIFFTGLLILDPNPDPDPNPQLGSEVNTCEVFVNRSAPNHHLSIEVRRKQWGTPDIIMMRHHGDLSFRATPAGQEPRYGMFIRVTGDSDPDNPHPKGVKRYDPASNARPSPEGDGFGLAFDLEGPQFHNEKLEIDKLAGRPSIVLNDAVFYTAAKTRVELEASLTKKDIKTNTDVVVVERLPPFASIIGANIYLDEGGAVIMTWREQGMDKRLSLEKQAEGVSYEIYIVNDPLYEADESPFSIHDELGEYYRLLPKVKERFKVVIPPPVPGEPFPDRGSTTTPCMPVVVGSGGGSS